MILLNGMVPVNNDAGFGFLGDNYILQLFNEGGERKEGITCFFLNMSFCFRAAVPEIIYYWKKYFFHSYWENLDYSSGASISAYSTRSAFCGRHNSAFPLCNVLQK